MDNVHHNEDVIFTQDSLIGFIKCIKSDIRGNYHFVSTNDMQMKIKANSNFNDDEEEINSKFSDDWKTTHLGQICVINTSYDTEDSNRYTWIWADRALKFEDKQIINDSVNKDERQAGSIYVEENNGTIKYFIFVKGFDDKGNYISYKTEITNEEISPLDSNIDLIDNSGNTQYFIQEENDDIGQDIIYTRISPNQVQSYLNNSIPVYYGNELYIADSKLVKTNIIECDNLKADVISARNINFSNKDTKINIINGDEAYRYVKTNTATINSDSYNYVKVGVGTNGDYIYNNKVFATLVDSPKDSVIRIKNPIIQNWTLDKTKGTGSNGQYDKTIGGVRFTGYVFKHIEIKYKQNDVYKILSSNDLLFKPLNGTNLSVETKYELSSNNSSFQQKYFGNNSLSNQDPTNYATTYTDITEISDYSSNLEYVNDIQQYKFLGHPSGITILYSYPLITGEDNKLECENEKLYFIDSKFYARDNTSNEISEILQEDSDVLIYDGEIIGVKKAISGSTSAFKITTYTLPFTTKTDGTINYGIYSPYNTYSGNGNDITTQATGSVLWPTSKTAFKHFLKIKTINDQIIELTKDSIGQIYDLKDIKSFIIDKKSYTTNQKYQNTTTTYTYKETTTEEILKENLTGEILKFILNENIEIPKYQYLESWSKATDLSEYDNTKNYYCKSSNNGIYTKYTYNINTWKDVLKNGLYIKNGNNYEQIDSTQLNYVRPSSNQQYTRIGFVNYTYNGPLAWTNDLQPQETGQINMYIFNAQSGVMDQITPEENHPSYNPNYYIFDDTTFEELSSEEIIELQNNNNVGEHFYYKEGNYYRLVKPETDISNKTIYKFEKYDELANFDTLKINGNYYYLENDIWKKVVNNTLYDENKSYYYIKFKQINSDLNSNYTYTEQDLPILIREYNLFLKQGGINYTLVKDEATWNQNLTYARLRSGPEAYTDDNDLDHAGWIASVKTGNMWLDLDTESDNKRYLFIKNEYQYDPAPNKEYYEKAINSYISDIIDNEELRNYYLFYHYNPDTWATDKDNIYLKNEFWFKNNLTEIYEQAAYGENTYYDIYGDFYKRELNNSNSGNNNSEGEIIMADPGAGQGEFDASVEGSITTLGGIAARKSIKGYKVHGAVFNDYAEYRHTENIESGRCVVETGNGDLVLSNKRLQLGANIVSDTYGFSIGETDHANTPIAVCGRVLAYPYEFKETFMPGQAVCSGPNGTVSRMTRDEICYWPDAIVGYVSEIPNYEEWGSDKVKVDGRIWIKVK